MVIPLVFCGRLRLHSFAVLKQYNKRGGKNRTKTKLEVLRVYAVG